MSRAAFFATCIGNHVYAEACADAVRVLRHFGTEVEVPPGQTCCGQPAHNAGRPRDAVALARRTLLVLAEAEYVVVPSGSCAGMLRHVYPRMLEGPDKRAALSLAERTFEFSEFLTDVVGVTHVGGGLEGLRVAYHHSCHALRDMGIARQPVALLQAAGALVVPWEADQECCGFGGLFSSKLPEVSGAMADRKLDTLPDVDCVTSTDAGCLMQLEGRARRQRRTVPFRHLASLIRQGLGA